MKEQLEELVKKWERDRNWYKQFAKQYKEIDGHINAAFDNGRAAQLEKNITDIKTILQQHA